jgi:ribosome-associated heat shock protein Hsp15
MTVPIPDPVSQRIDLWLWHARFFKTRSLAARMVESGFVRLGGQRVDKPSRQVRPDDVLTISLRSQILVVRVSSIAARRGPPAEARLLYAPLEPGAPSGRIAAAPPGVVKPADAE